MLGPGLELRNENRPSNYVVAESLLQLKVNHKSLPLKPKNVLYLCFLFI